MRFARLIRPIVVLVAAALLLQGVWTTIEIQHRKGFIPEKLATGALYADTNCGDILSYQGAYLFSLKRDTILALKRDGLRYFDDIDERGNRPSTDYFHGSWLATPMPVPRDEGDLDNLHCALRRGRGWPPGILEALQRPGGFYQTSGRRTLIVLPNEGYLIAVASDR